MLQDPKTMRWIKIAVVVVIAFFVLKFLFASNNNGPIEKIPNEDDYLQKKEPEEEKEIPRPKIETHHERPITKGSDVPGLSEKFYLSHIGGENVGYSFTPEEQATNEVVAAIGTLSHWEAENGKAFVEFYQIDEGSFSLLPQMREVRRVAKYHFNPNVVGSKVANRLANFLFASMTHPCERETTHHDPEQIKTQFQDQFGRDSPANLARFISPDAVVLDIGAFNGRGTLTMAPFASLTIAFEVNPWIFPILYENARLNPHFNIHPYNYGASTSSGSEPFNHRSEGGYGICDAVKSGGGQTGSYKRFPVVNVPQFLEENYKPSILEKIKFIRLDIGGNELNILDTLEPLIQRSKPLVLMSWPKTTSQNVLLELQADFEVLNFPEGIPVPMGAEFDVGTPVLLVPSGKRLSDYTYDWF